MSVTDTAAHATTPGTPFYPAALVLEAHGPLGSATFFFEEYQTVAQIFGEKLRFLPQEPFLLEIAGKKRCLVRNGPHEVESVLSYGILNAIQETLLRLEFLVHDRRCNMRPLLRLNPAKDRLVCSTLRDINGKALEIRAQSRHLAPKPGEEILFDLPFAPPALPDYLLPSAQRGAPNVGPALHAPLEVVVLTEWRRLVARFVYSVLLKTQAEYTGTLDEIAQLAAANELEIQKSLLASSLKYLNAARVVAITHLDERTMRIARGPVCWVRKQKESPHEKPFDLSSLLNPV